MRDKEKDRKVVSTPAAAPATLPAVVYVLTEESNGSSGDGPDNVVLSVHATEAGALAARDVAVAARKQEGCAIWGDDDLEEAEDSPGLQALSAADVDDWQYDFHIETMPVVGHPDPLAAELALLRQFAASVKAILVDGRGRWILDPSGADVVQDLTTVLSTAGFGGYEARCRYIK